LAVPVARQEIAERGLAHLPGGIVGRYDKHLSEKRDALAKLILLAGEIVK
jgi:hypothetical protein